MKLHTNIAHICRACREGQLRVVEGSKGRMVNCVKCGWTGPRKRDG